MSNFTEKIDVLDLLLQTLRDHEEKLDQLVTRLEAQAPRRHQVDDTKNMIRFYDRFPGEC